MMVLQASAWSCLFLFVQLATLLRVWAKSADSTSSCSLQEAKANWLRTIQMVEKDCGSLCVTRREGRPHRLVKTNAYNEFYEELDKDVDCPAIFESSSLFDNLPSPLILCTTDGRKWMHIKTDSQWSTLDKEESSKLLQEQELYWTKDFIEHLRQMFREGQMYGSYGQKSVNQISNHIDEHMLDHVTGGHVLVIGSQLPWLETILLEKGAAKVTTLEYLKIRTTHPNITLITPHEFNEEFLEKKTFEGEEGKFDALVTFSSLEHSGLGRYGDGLNPWGDIITMAKAWCVTKRGARALVGVPSSAVDQVKFNAGRLYGPIQLSHLLANWKLIYTKKAFDGSDPRAVGDREIFFNDIFIVEKRSNNQQ